MSDFDNERINNLYQGLASKYEQRWACVEIESLRAELTEARRQLKKPTPATHELAANIRRNLRHLHHAISTNQHYSVLLDFVNHMDSLALQIEVEPNALAAPVQQPAVPEAVAKDAARYRWLRKQFWADSPACVVMNPKVALKLGADCPSEHLLDKEIDAAILSATDSEVKK